MFRSIFRLLRQFGFDIIFRRKNRHNSVIPKSIFPINSVKIGSYTYGPLLIEWMASSNTKVEIGNYCSIGPKVTFLVGGEHNYKRISTWPFQTKVYEESSNSSINRDIIVEDDVWIGYDALIMSGAVIGKGSVIGAKSVVKGVVPPYSIYVGSKVIKSRFNDSIISKIERIDYSHITHKRNDNYQKFCQTELTEDNVDMIISSFENSEECEF